MSVIPENTLAHYGMPRRSGRYPWGSGEEPYQRSSDLIGRVRELKKKGMSDTEIAAELKIFDKYGKPSSGKLRTQLSWANDVRTLHDVARIKSLRSDGLGWTEIGKIMGKSESTIRSMIKPDHEARAKVAFETANFIRKQIKKNGMVDVGTDVANELGIKKERLQEALYILEQEGYPVHGNRFEQQTNLGFHTTQRVICAPGTPAKAIYDLDKIHPLNEDKYVSTDDGEHFDQIVYPKSLDSKRMMVRYADDVGLDGARGIDKDGIVEIRRGVKDLNLDGSNYSQVRILVDGTHYIKGMAVYADDLPDGVDLVFNTNKTNDTPMMGDKNNSVLKPIKKDDDNPFGSLLKSQVYYTDENGERQLTPINKRADQGDWTDWKDALPSQFLSKQPLPLIKRQLGIAKADKQAEFEDICSLTNPTIKRHLLQKFADECDSAAVHLKAAALPGQKYHVIIPVNTLKDNEIYAPQYENGTELALVRYPHGGIFEIPILKVNNTNPLGGKMIGSDSIDAVGINKKNADRLSGADFDGDTVMCIPTRGSTGIDIKNKPLLKGLEGFDPKLAYPERPGMRYMKHGNVDNTQKEMGVISNLITDMTLGGASDDELAAAVRHSMVVIDAKKHNLDYTRSEVENNIPALKKKWQVKVDANGNVKYGGASTIISRAKSETSIDKRQGSGKIDPETGKVIYKPADDLYYPIRKFDKDTGEVVVTTANGKRVRYDPKNKEAVEKYAPVKVVDKETGEVTFTNKAGDITYKSRTKTQKSTAMADTDDAYTLVSKRLDNSKERAYADYANSMKALANEARKTLVATDEMKRDPTAAATYASEVKSLDEKLRLAQLNAPRERAAQRKAGATVKAKINEAKESGEELSKSDIKKLRQQATSAARTEYNAISRRDRNIEITDLEWEAIQAGAISKTTLRKILNNTDTAALRQRATPKKTDDTITAVKANQIYNMSKKGISLSQISKDFNVSTSTVNKINRIKNASASGKSPEQIAETLGISVSTVYKYLEGSD